MLGSVAIHQFFQIVKIKKPAPEVHLATSRIGQQAKYIDTAESGFIVSVQTPYRNGLSKIKCLNHSINLQASLMLVLTITLTAVHPNMLSSSDTAITYALANVRYQAPLWLHHQTIESTKYNDVVAFILKVCNANGLPLSRRNLIEPQSSQYFEEHKFFNLVFTTDLTPRDLPLVSPAVLEELKLLGEIDASKRAVEIDLEAKKEEGRSLLFSGNAHSQIFLKVALIPFGGNPRPEAVFCIQAALTNVPNIWNLLYFPTNI